MNRTTAYTEFIDKKKTIIIRGHYTSFVCGALTMVDRLARKRVIKDITMVDNYDTVESDYICSAIKFSKKSDSDTVKEIINSIFDNDESNWQYSEEIIKILEKEEKRVKNK
ncbi:MAG: hypothetical protein ACK5HR_03055 [Mycoplasmatales bacterium]